MGEKEKVQGNEMRKARTWEKADPAVLWEIT